MHVRFYGAVREVTGSMHLVETENGRILLDCGMFQGRREVSDRKNRTLPFDPAIITNLLLSHAHIDHSGRIPLLVKEGFNGSIICTRVTADACGYLLPDSAHIQESDASYLNYKRVRKLVSQTTGRSRQEVKKILKKGKHNIDAQAVDSFLEKYDMNAVRPLYSIKDAEDALACFSGQPYHSPVTVGEDISCTFYEAGHILGSAVTILRVKENGRSYTIGFTGDIGRYHKPILKDPEGHFDDSDREIDLLIMESTYGDRVHDPVGDMRGKLKAVINETVERGGAVIVPAFAYGRTQELLYTIHDLYDRNETPRVPVYVDSPLATRITRVFGEHPEVYDQKTHEDFLRKGENPFMFPELKFTESVEESMALNRDNSPHIVLSASGMCEAGRILHHLRFKIHNEKNTILIVGYMAEHTLGRRLAEKGLAFEASGRNGQPPLMRLMGKEYPLLARVVKLDGFSAHGDKNEMLKFLNESNLKIKKIALVHGEEDQMLVFADTLTGQGFDVFVPRVGESLVIR
ncbi:MAG: MBL fold metallo-hydrolase [Deltaproteobacteria bacterium]|nr:MBL fold metallo-hydrolase [Deltaproteobacteria bacterium]